jgi:hypothetical protein
MNDKGMRQGSDSLRPLSGASYHHELDLGIHLENTTPMLIPAPVTVPLIAAVKTNPSQHT